MKRRGDWAPRALAGIARRWVLFGAVAVAVLGWKPKELAVTSGAPAEQVATALQEAVPDGSSKKPLPAGGEAQPLAIGGAPPPADRNRTRPNATDDGAEVGEDYVQANTAYEEGRYPKAVELYQRVIDAGVYTGDLFFNLGNAHLRSGELGLAIGSYLRCRSLLPRDEDVEANLRFARQSTLDALEPPAASPAMRTLFFWHYVLSRDEIVRAAVTLNAILWTLLAVRLWRRGSEALRWLTYAALVLLLAIGGSLAMRWLRPVRVAVILPQEVDGLAGNSVDSLALFPLHSGAEVRVVEQRPGWIRVRLPDGRNGWIPEEHAEVVVR